MSSISGVGAGAPANVFNVAAAKKAVSAFSAVRDSDGDYDGTAPGKVDAKDMGKGAQLDRTA